MASVTLVVQWLKEQHYATLLHLPFTLSLLIIFSVFILLRLINGSWSQKSNLLPSPPKLPIIGNLHQIGTLVHRSLRDLSDRYGPIMLLHLGGTPTVIVSSTEMAKEIMKTHDIVFANRPFTRAANILLYGCTDIGFSPYGEYWRQIRKMAVNELLSIKKIQSFKYVREEEVSLMIKKIRQSSLAGGPTKLTELLLALTNSTLSRCALGMKHEDEDGENKFGELSRELMKLFGASTFGDAYPWLGWMDVLTGLVGRMKKISRELDMFFDQIIDEHILHKKDYLDDKNDFLDLLLHVQQNNILGINLTRDNIKAITLDMFIGGSETSATTLEWTMAELLRNPNVMKKAQEEVRKVAAKKSKVDEDDIHQMDYLKCVVKETLRLHAPVPLLLPRESSTSTNIKGYHFPSKTRVIINAWAIQRDSTLWDSPNEFIPERFMANPIDFKGHDYEYIPFGSGRRICPGMSFASTLVEFSVANLLYWFDWELPGDANKEELDMTENFGLTAHKKIPLHLVATSHFS